MSPPAFAFGAILVFGTFVCFVLFVGFRAIVRYGDGPSNQDVAVCYQPPQETDPVPTMSQSVEEMIGEIGGHAVAPRGFIAINDDRSGVIVGTFGGNADLSVVAFNSSEDEEIQVDLASPGDVAAAEALRDYLMRWIEKNRGAKA